MTRQSQLAVRVRSVQARFAVPAAVLSALVAASSAASLVGHHGVRLVDVVTLFAAGCGSGAGVALTLLARSRPAANAGPAGGEASGVEADAPLPPA